MIFNSLNFFLFFSIIFIFYWFFLNKKKIYQNIFLLIASYYFYATWDYRFLTLLIFSTFIDYIFGLIISNESRKKVRQIILFISLFVNLGVLIFFKYYNFFVLSFQKMFISFGLNFDLKYVSIIIPIGISFYTFHGVSYVVDIYRNKISSEKNFITYSLFVSYFPLLIAGPIERASHLLPQLNRTRKFCYFRAIDGLKQILWGVFKKIVIADNSAEYANLIFNDYNNFNGSTLLIGALFFSFQIYGDFSGYSDIALGTSRLFGIELLKNFSYPYFSRNIGEFWRRWHISLSSWFKDYLYFPMGGSRISLFTTIRNTIIIFLLSGFWHGANWTFIVWGLLNGIFLIPSIFFNTNRSYIEIVANKSILPTKIEFIKISSTFILITLVWIFFRSLSIIDALAYIKIIFSKTTFERPEFPNMGYAFVVVLLIIIFILIEWKGRREDYGIKNLHTKYSMLNFICYSLILFVIFYFSGSSQQFIYFQF